MSAITEKELERIMAEEEDEQAVLEAVESFLRSVGLSRVKEVLA